MNESIESIVTEMRERADAMQTHGTTHGVRLAVLEFARRIEAVWKRESKAIATENAVLPAVCITKPSGNEAAMREALEDVLEKIDRWRTDGVMEHWQYSQLFDIADSALSAPPRQCDVGTAEEQGNRMRLFCAKQKRNGIINCGYCPIKHQYERDCTLDWAQMPYEAEEGGAK